MIHPKYLLDSNVFIQSKNLYYGFDFCPAFWEFLINENDKGNIASIEKVAEELHKQEDGLSEWAKDRKKTFFLSPCPIVMSKLPTVSECVNSRKKRDYSQSSINKFLNGADYWLIAHALTKECIVVTSEKGVQLDSKKVKIPDVCSEFNLHCITPHEMLRNEGARFILDRTFGEMI